MTAPAPIRTYLRDRSNGSTVVIAQWRDVKIAHPYDHELDVHANHYAAADDLVRLIDDRILDSERRHDPIPWHDNVRPFRQRTIAAWACSYDDVTQTCLWIYAGEPIAAIEVRGLGRVVFAGTRRTIHVQTTDSEPIGRVDTDGMVRGLADRLTKTQANAIRKAFSGLVVFTF